MAKRDTAKILKKALRRHEAGDHERARALYRQVLRQDPDHIDAHYLLGTLHAECKENEAAIRHLERALTLAPDSAMASSNLASVHLNLGDAMAAERHARRALARQPDLAPARVALGSALRLQERFPEAAEAYRYATLLAPGLVEAHHGLGTALFSMGRFDEAIPALERAAGQGRVDADDVLLAAYSAAGSSDEQRAECARRLVARRPDHPFAKHLLDGISGATPSHPPAGYVETLFDGYAASFDASMRNLECRIPELLLQAVQAEGRTHFDRAVDLGCGTGAVGALVADRVGKLTGVDLSSEMTARAMATGHYHEAAHADAVDFLATTRDVDLVLAADVLIYVGDLDPLFVAVSRALAPDGLFVSSVELCEAEFELRQSGRYAHSDSYLRSAAARAGLKISSNEKADLRRERGRWIAGAVLSMRRC